MTNRAFRVSRRSGNISDTHPTAEREHIKLLRDAGPVRRAALALNLSQEIMQISRQGLRQRHPELTEQELDLRCLALRYGDQLAERVRRYLADRRM